MRSCPFCGSCRTTPVKTGERGAMKCRGCGAVGPDVYADKQPEAVWHVEALRRWKERANV